MLVDIVAEAVIIILSALDEIFWGRSSGGERLTHIQEVGGSKPLVPTSKMKGFWAVYARKPFTFKRWFEQ